MILDTELRELLKLKGGNSCLQAVGKKVLPKISLCGFKIFLHFNLVANAKKPHYDQTYSDVLYSMRNY